MRVAGIRVLREVSLSQSASFSHSRLRGSLGRDRSAGVSPAVLGKPLLFVRNMHSELCAGAAGAGLGGVGGRVKATHAQNPVMVLDRAQALAVGAGFLTQAKTVLWTTDWWFRHS